MLKDSPRAGDEMRNMEKTGHLAWCALIALLTAREDGLVASESQENLFITRWFAQVKKQRRFSRDVATDVDWILNQGRTLGVRARLRHKLDYLWRSCTGELSEQNDLFRLPTRWSWRSSTTGGITSSATVSGAVEIRFCHRHR